MSNLFERPGPPKGLSDGWDLEQEREAKSFLESMKAKGWIDFDSKLLSEKIHGYRPGFINESGEASSLQWFETVDFDITFTLAGYEYLGQQKMSDSIIQTNKASRRNFIVMSCLTAILVIVSLIGVLQQLQK